jgi:orotidine-5'-phosphate decarboxylase
VAGRYLGTLAARCELVGSCLCLGIDPDPEGFPEGFPPDAEGLERFARLLLDAALPYAAAVKANVAFFEAFGSAGVAALERLRGLVPPGVPFIADAKRADIGSTSARYAAALFDALGADAVTANPYLGRDALEPLLERRDRFVYVLARTSNPGAAEFQDLELDGEPLYLHVARRAGTWAQEHPGIGLVVGATAPLELAAIRAAVPALPFLVPGLGSQGGQVSAVLEHGPAGAGPAESLRGRGLLVNVSRAIAGEARQAADPGQAIAQAAARWSALIRC